MPFPSNPSEATQIFSGSSKHDLSSAAKLLRSGLLVAFPTETVYGLGADATNTAAVSSIFEAKRRPVDNPLIVHLSRTEDLARHKLTPLPLSPIALRLVEAFWPGPLTLVLPLAKESRLSPLVTGGLDSVAIRVPSHPVANALLTRAQIPVAAPSANLSGRPSPTCAQHVLRDLSDVIDAVVDASSEESDPSTPFGLESTVVDLTSKPTVLRPGAVSLEDLYRASGIQFFKASDIGAVHDATPKAPGMKYRHYAPIAPLYVIDEQLKPAIHHWRKMGKRVGILADKRVCREAQKHDDVVCVPCGHDGKAESFAQSLYAALRAFDGEGDQAVTNPVDIILAVPPADTADGIGEAVMNRLSKASTAREDIYHVTN